MINVFRNYRMQKLTQNIIGIFGKKGKIWLDHLPLFVEQLRIRWNLSQLVPVDNMTYNYVVKAITNDNRRVVLKIGCDVKSIEHERLALKHFDGNGSIKLMDDDKEYHALLLQQAVPGISLKSFYPAQADFVIDRYAETTKKLHAKPLPDNHHFAHIRDWLTAIDSVESGQIPENLLKKALRLKKELLESPGRQVVLHGDLHHDNILNDGNDWLAIDPKGIIGEPEFEAAAFDFIHSAETIHALDVQKLFGGRAALLAQKSNLSLQRIKDWVFVRLILAAAWSIEDKSDPGWDIEQARRLGEKDEI